MLKKIFQIFLSIGLGSVFSVIFFVLLIRWVNPPFTSFTLREDWSQLDGEFYNLRTYWVPLSDIPEHMVWAVVASEDQLFFQHHGFDVESIEEAWEDYQEGVRTRGASTISQQVSKNLFLWPAQSFFRKGVEAAITVGIELLWPKERIIEVYLNIAEFGPGLFGIGKASDYYFNRPASQLGPEMAARFAAVLPSPKRMRVEPPTPYTQERSRWILQQMNQLTGRIYWRDTEPTEVAELDTTAQDSSAQMSDSLSDDTDPFDPDTLFQNLPETQQSLSDTSSDTTDSVSGTLRSSGMN